MAVPSDPPSTSRDYSPLDLVLMRLQGSLGKLAAHPSAQPDGAKPLYPGTACPEPALEPEARRHAAGLMRINHAGEIAAQALYRGQALVAQGGQLREHLLKAAGEEQSHLTWCETRLQELGDRPSRLAPLWYAGSFAIGAVAGLGGDRTSLGFVEETEKQVVAHLDDHLGQLPAGDARSRAILEAMRADEMRHGRDAREAGARRLPAGMRGLMAFTARIMKFGAYRF